MIIQDLASFIEGNIVGKDSFFDDGGFTGRFTFLNDAVEGDIVIRHKIMMFCTRISQKCPTICVMDR